ncbi:MAG: VOC family protein [Pseudonocardia sp.]|nr:VOC family protein [Pseudonocardia sp.]
MTSTPGESAPGRPALGIGAVTVDCADPGALSAFWAAALGTDVAVDHGDFVFLTPPAAGGVSLGFQRVPEERAGKNRLHLDLATPPGTRTAEVARLVGLGATQVHEMVGEVPGIDWTTLADPEGNQFCVGEHQG